jgi:hypothetical protein
MTLADGARKKFVEFLIVFGGIVLAYPFLRLWLLFDQVRRTPGWWPRLKIVLGSALGIAFGVAIWGGLWCGVIVGLWKAAYGE